MTVPRRSRPRGAGARIVHLPAAGFALLALLPGFAAAQAWPERPIRPVVPLRPGGAADLTARVLAAGLATRLGQAVTVENRSGAGGNIAIEHVARAGELAAVLGREGATLTRASAGGLQAIACGLLKLEARAEVTTVPYRGGAMVLADMSAGDVDLTFSLGHGAADYVAAGRVRALASTDEPRRAAAAGLPALSATLPGFVLTGLQAVVAPAGTDRAVVARLHREIVAILQDPEVRRRLAGMAIEPVGSTPQEFARRLDDDVERYARIVREAGLRPR